MFDLATIYGPWKVQLKGTLCERLPYPLEPHHWSTTQHVLLRFSPSKGWCVDLCRLQLGGALPAVFTLGVNVVNRRIRLIELGLVQLPASIHGMGHNGGKLDQNNAMVDYG